MDNDAQHRRAALLALAAEIEAAPDDEAALQVMRAATGLTVTDVAADRAELARRRAAATASGAVARPSPEEPPPPGGDVAGPTLPPDRPLFVIGPCKALCAGLVGGCPDCRAAYLHHTGGLDGPLPVCMVCDSGHWPWEPHADRQSQLGDVGGF